MVVKRKRTGGRPDVVAEVDDFELSLLVDPRSSLVGFDAEAALSSMSEIDRQKVETICGQLGISVDGRDRVLRVLCELIERKKNASVHDVRTVKNDRDDLAEIAGLAHQLAVKVSDLPDNLKMILMVSCQQLVDECLPHDWQLRYRNGCGLVAPMEVLHSGAERAVGAFGDVVNGGGRKPVLDHHGWHILDIWRAVEGEGLEPARGQFLQLCNAVFDAAGFPSGAEGAVRYFMKHLAYVIPDSVEATMSMLDRISEVDKSQAKTQRKNPASKPAN